MGVPLSWKHSSFRRDALLAFSLPVLLHLLISPVKRSNRMSFPVHFTSGLDQNASHTHAVPLPADLHLAELPAPAWSANPIPLHNTYRRRQGSYQPVKAYPCLAHLVHGYYLIYSSCVPSLEGSFIQQLITIKRSTRVLRVSTS